MRKTKMALAVLFCIACLVVAFSIPQELFFVGYVLGFTGGTVVWSVWDWQLFMMEKEKERV